ncbi:TadE/TadG family type IV pilus assembly protein [Tatumella morbirosei]|nr:TadE/TadG family type IV pilus assembly protein [Tatumella morbirosei]
MRTMIRMIKRLGNREHGSITLEFAFIFIIFVFFVFLIFEVCRYMYISASVDLTLAEAARITSRSEEIVDYPDLFARTVDEQSDLLSMFIDPDDFTLKITYCSSVSAAMTGNCSSGSGSKYPLAIYSASYRYQPLLFSYDDDDSSISQLLTSLNKPISRRLVYVQEYERGDQ